MRRSTLRTAMARPMIVALIFVSLLLALARPACAETPAVREAKQLHELFDAEWQWSLREYPEFATAIGDPRYNDRLNDRSEAAIERTHAHERDALKRIREIDRTLLTGQDVVSYDLYRRGTEERVELQRFPAERMPISPMGGVHIAIPELPRIAPLRTAKDYDDFLARLAAYPRQVDQIIELMKRGIATGWVQPAVAISKVPDQIEKQWLEDVTTSPLYKPFEAFPDAIAAVKRPGSRSGARSDHRIDHARAQEAASVHRRHLRARVPARDRRVATAGRACLLCSDGPADDDDQPVPP